MQFRKKAHWCCLLAVIWQGCTQPVYDYRLRQMDQAYQIERNDLVLQVDRTSGGLSLQFNNKEILATSQGAFESAALVFINGESYRPVAAVKLAHQHQSGVTFDLCDQSGQPLGLLQVATYPASIVGLRVTPSVPVTAYGWSFDIDSAGHMYGQGELTYERIPFDLPTSQYFPLDAGSYARPVLTTNEGSNIITPLWLTATGAAIFHDSYSYLSIVFNQDDNRHFVLHMLPTHGEKSFEIHLLAAENTRQVYLDWVATKWSRRPDLPVGTRPPDVLFTKPIWTTWAMYKKQINQSLVLQLANQIVEHGYESSYLEIDDIWTPTYGDLRFRSDRFSEPSSMVEQIHQLGMGCSLWVPPFVNKTAQNFEEGSQAKAFVAAQDQAYPALVGWWNTAGLALSATIDFTAEAGRAFWGEQVDAAKTDYGVDGYKYDAGEAVFLPEQALLASGVHPNAYADHYARWGLVHNGLEMRAGYFAQQVPVAFRQFDKDTHWGLDNGLASVLTQILALGLIGYPFILPDMVGGNEYLKKADDELFIRWMQLTAWLPMVQFSILPWREGFSAAVGELTLQAMQQRKVLNDYLLALADEAATTQLPMVRPLFFEFPEDQKTYTIGDQFMLGAKYLVAPVLQPGMTSRSVYLPTGNWRALGGQEILQGPLELVDYPAPLEQIPVFERL